MMIHLKLLIAIATVVSIAIAYLLFRLTSKNKKYVRGGFIAFFTILFVFTGLMMMNSRAYIVKSKTDLGNFAVYGSPEYTFGDGTKLTLNIPIQKCMIINDTGEDLMIEKVVYTTSGFSNAKDVPIKNLSHFTINSLSIDYIFDDAPPKQITTKNSNKEVRYWLRTKKDYEADYGKTLGDDQIEKLRDALKRKRQQD